MQAQPPDCPAPPQVPNPSPSCNPHFQFKLFPAPPPPTLQASLGIARLLVRLLQQRGVPEFKARAAIWLIDRRGLVTTARKDLTPEKAQFAQASGVCGFWGGGRQPPGR